MPVLTIKSSIEINEILKQGRKIHSTSYMIFYLTNNTTATATTTLAVLAGKKLFKRAVDRNFAKRRLRALARQARIQDCPGLRVVIMAKKSLESDIYSEILNDLKFKLSILQNQLMWPPLKTN